MMELPNIPNSWKWAEISKCTSYVQRGKSPKYSTASELPIINQKCIRWDRLDLSHTKFVHRDQISAWSEERYLKNGDLLWNSTGTGTIGRACLFEMNGSATKYVVDSHVTIVRAKPELLPRFLLHWIASPFVQSGFEKLQAGSTNQVELSRRAVLETKVPIPPFDVQSMIVKRITSLFSEIDTGTDELAKTTGNLALYKQSVLNAAIQGRLVPQDPNDEPASKLLQRIRAEKEKLILAGKLKKEKPLPPIDPGEVPFELPKGWEWVKLGQLLSEKLCNGISVKGSDNPPGIRALKLSAMSDQGFDYSDIRYLPLKESQVSDLRIKQGDFFIARGNGSLHLVGRGTVAQKTENQIIFPDTMIRLRLFGQVSESRWISAIWPSRFIREQIESRVKTTAGIYKIAQPQVESILIPLPPIELQCRLVRAIEDQLNVSRQLIQVASEEMTRAQLLRHSILKSAFEGTLV